LLLYKRNFAGKYRFRAWKAVVNQVQQISSEKETIFGNYLVTPLVALKAKREITAWEGDTNTQRYLAGLLSRERTTRLATGSALFLQSVKLDKNGRLAAADPAFVRQEVIEENCRVQGRYDLPGNLGLDTLLLWQCGVCQP
jgi:hypothetical protein